MVDTSNDDWLFIDCWGTLSIACVVINEITANVPWKNVQTCVYLERNLPIDKWGQVPKII